MNRYAKIQAGVDGLRIIDLFDESLTFLPTELFDNKIDLRDGAIVMYSSEQQLTIESIVAAPSTALASIWLALSENEVIPYFPAPVTSEVQLIADDPGIDDQSLTDLTHLPFITIDNVDSRDLDQAMHISRDESGYILHYALADAAHFVRYRTALFEEALRRGSSYYVPGFAVPMLPRVLSEDLVSLNEGKPRRALVFVIRFDSRGTVLQTTVQQARIRSAAKLSYTGVEAYYSMPASSALHDQAYTPTLDALRELGKLRIEEARLRNVVEYNRSSVEIKLTEDGSTFDILDTDRLQVEKYNEQISLVCNAEGARLLRDAGLPSIVQAVYRVHEAPDEDRLKKFSRLLKGMVRAHNLPAELWIWRWRDGKYGKREYLADYLERLKDHNVDPGLLAAIQRNALMLSPASRFTSEASGHHSLKLEQYARFSSPMREIAGIYTHREYLQLMSHNDASENLDDGELREQVLQAANRSKEIQKRLNKAVMKIAIDQLFKEQLDLPLEDRTVWRGVVMSLRATRVYVRLEAPGITVKVYLRGLSKLNGVTYTLDKSSAFIAGDDGSTIALGEAVQLQVRSYSEDSAKWRLVPVGSLPV